MKRIDFKELHEYRFCPGILRDGLTDFLSFLWKIGVYTRAIRTITRLMKLTESTVAADLCSGAGGYLPGLRATLMKKGIRNLRVVRTDLFPHRDAPDSNYSASGVEICNEPLTAEDAMDRFEGVATMFSALHHFREEELASIFRKAAATGHAFAFFDISQRRFFTDILSNILMPLHVWFLTPFIRPFRWSRLLFTYPIPLIPLLIAIDGTLSRMRAYTTEELRAITDPVEDAYSGYIFTVWTYPLLGGLQRVTCVVGCSISSDSAGKQNQTDTHEMHETSA